MDDILKVIKSPASAQKYKKLNDFVNKVKEEDLPIIFAHPDIITNGPTFLLQLATKFRAPSLFLQIVEKVPARDVRKRACKSPFLYSPESPLLETEFLEEFLSGSSYSIRRTIVNNLGVHVKDQDVGDEIFQSVKTFYGLFAAAPILPVCSAPLLSKILNDDRIEISDRAFVRILKSHPEIGLNYLKRIVPDIKFNRYRNTFKYCLMNHPEDYVAIFDEHDLVYDEQIVAGRSETRRLLKSNYRRILEKILTRKSSDLCCLRMDEIFKGLPWEDYIKLAAKRVRNYIKADSNSTDALDAPLTPFLKPLNQANQQDLIRHCCKSVLDLEVSQAGSFLTPSLIFLLNKEDRSILSEFKIKSQDEDRCVGDISNESIRLYCWGWESKEFWTAMKPAEESIPVLTKMLLREQSAERRATIGAALIFTCCVNRDSVEMLKVLQLLTKRSRNDQKVVRDKIMEVLDFVANFLRFDQDHWDSVLELLRLLKANGELYIYNHQTLLQGYFGFLLENNRPVDPLIKFIVSLISSRQVYYFPYEFFRRPPRIYKQLTREQEKMLLDGYLQEFASSGLDPEDSKKLQLQIKTVEPFVKKLMELNKKNPAPTLHDYPWLEKVLMSSLKAGEGINNKGYVLRQIGSKALEAALESSSLFQVDLIFALKKHPEKLEKKFESVMEQTMTAPFEVSRFGQVKNHKYQHFFKQLKRRNFKSLSDKLLKESVRILEENDEEKITNAFKVLLTLASPSLAIQYVQDFIPKESKVEPDEIDGEMYKIQRTIAAYLRFVQDPQAILPVVQKFCVGDYLKPSIGSLYGTVLNVPGLTARKFLEESLKNSPVSPKKHMIRLYFTAGPVEDQKIALEQMWPVEKNLSIRIELLQRASYLLGTNAREDVWQVYKSILESLTPDDQDCLDCVVSNLRKLTPPEYLTQVVKVFANTLERMDAIETHQLKFIEQIEHLVDRLDDEFLDNFIRNKLDQLAAGETSSLANLAVEFLLKSHQDKLEHRIHLISTSVRNILEHKWNDSETEYQEGGKHSVKYPARLFLQDFIKKLLNPSILEDSHQRQISQKIYSEILPYFEQEAFLTKAFSNAVSIEFALDLLHVYNDEDKASQFGERLAIVLDNFITKFGGEILSVLADILKSFVEDHFALNPLESKLELIQGLLRTGRSKHNLIFAVQLLPPQSPYASAKLKEIRASIVNVIENSADLTVKVFYELSSSKSQD